MNDDITQILSDNVSISKEASLSNETSAPEEAVDTLLLLEQSISSLMKQKRSLKEELTKQREMLESTLLNDETYRLHCDAAKQAAKIKGKTKMEILKLPANAALAEKIKNLAQEIKDLDNDITSNLLVFTKTTGLNTIEDENGEIQEIIYVPKLVKKSSKK